MSNTIMQKEIRGTLSDLVVKEPTFNQIEELTIIQQVYNAGIKEIRTKLEILDDEYRVKHDFNPIHHMEYRLKSVRSIIEKLHRRDLEVSIDSMRNNLFDIAGVRVICNYIDDIYRIADVLTKQDDITLLERKDYIKNPKPNGYRSLHIVVQVPIFLAGSTELIPVEIQIRTIAMDFWASLEHHIKYKTTFDVPESVKDELTECARTISKLDHKMQGIHDELVKHTK